MKKPYALILNCSPDDADIYLKYKYDYNDIMIKNNFIIHDEIEYAPNVYFCDSSALGKAINDIISSIHNINNKIHVIATQDRRKFEHTCFKLKQKNIDIIKMKVQRFTNDDWRQFIVSKNSAYPFV